jgi:hypothetical protein
MTAAILGSLIARADRAAKQGTSPLLLPRELTALLGTLEHALNCMNRGCEPCNALLEAFSAPAAAASAEVGQTVDSAGISGVTQDNGSTEVRG